MRDPNYLPDVVEQALAERRGEPQPRFRPPGPKRAVFGALAGVPDDLRQGLTQKIWEEARRQHRDSSSPLKETA